MAQAEFAGITEPDDLLAAVSSWVGDRLRYVPGSSGPTDGAVDTMLQRQRVCRDYAHLVIALLRGMDVPDRLVAVYAPDLQPMDLHAVAEAAVGELWRVVDATLLAPRSSPIRITTGRDAADTAFLTSYGAQATLLESTVTVTTDGTLSGDDVTELISITSGGTAARAGHRWQPGCQQPHPPRRPDSDRASAPGCELGVAFDAEGIGAGLGWLGLDRLLGLAGFAAALVLTHDDVP
jgi:hypothetical protein